MTCEGENRRREEWTWDRTRRRGPERGEPPQPGQREAKSDRREERAHPAEQGSDPQTRKDPGWTEVRGLWAGNISMGSAGALHGTPSREHRRETCRRAGAWPGPRGEPCSIIQRAPARPPRHGGVYERRGWAPRKCTLNAPVEHPKARKVPDPVGLIVSNQSRI